MLSLLNLFCGLLQIRLTQGYEKVGTKCGQSWYDVGTKLRQSWHKVGTKLA